MAIKKQTSAKPTRNKSGRNNPRNSDRRATGKNADLHLYGIHTVRAALLNDERKKTRLMISKNAISRLDINEDKLTRLVEVREANTSELDNLVGRDAVHQGAVLQCQALTPNPIEALNPGDRVVVLDQISDPHNVGAIMRSCVAFNVNALIATSRNSSAQSAVLAKSASGAADMIDFIEVSNLSRALEKLNAQGYSTVGLDSEGGGFLEQILPDGPVAIVLGAEGRGMRQKTRETCTHLARLNIPGRIKSLNVSNAAALALYIAFGK